MRVLQLINHLSIDVAFGAVVSSLFFAKLFNVEVDVASLLLLGLVVWLIYTFDHLQDAKAINKRALTARHQLHQDFRRLLSVGLVIGLLLAAILVFFIPFRTLLWGASLFCLVAAYFICLHFLNVSVRHYKEAIIAILYTAGVLLPVVSIYHEGLSLGQLLIIAEYVVIAFTNLIIFSYLESDSDRNQKFPSLVLSIGYEQSVKLLYGLVAVHLILLSSIVIFSKLFLISLLLATMVLLLYLTVLFAKQATRNVGYRIVGDAVFILPVLVL